MSDTVLQLTDIKQFFVQGEGMVYVLNGVNLTIKHGEMVALLGPSGSGKSCLLHIAGLLDYPKSGGIAIHQHTVPEHDAARTRLRSNEIGFVYQFHNLLAEFTALENVAMPARLLGKTRKQAEEKATALLHKIGLQQRLSHFPSQLSGGEQQRVAIARALMNEPSLLLADEPTGSLDQTTGKGVFDILKEQARLQNCGLLMATHDETLAAQADRIISLVDGRLHSA